MLQSLFFSLPQRALQQTLPQLQQVRYFSKRLSKSATKRIPLTTKRAGKGFYKGKGCTKEGHLTSKARFHLDPLKRLQLMVPSLEGFKLKPYVAASVSKVPPETRRKAGEVAA